MSERIEELLAPYSALHDAVLESLALSADRTLTLTISAEHDETAVWDRLILRFAAVSRLSITTPPQDASLADYAFPVETTIDGFNVRRRDDAYEAAVIGAYGWRLGAVCASIELASS